MKSPTIEAQAAAWLAHVRTYPVHRGEFVAWLSEQQQAGRIDWPDVRRWQAAAMPRCRICGGDCTTDELCANCYSLAKTGAPLPNVERLHTPQRSIR